MSYKMLIKVRKEERAEKNANPVSHQLHPKLKELEQEKQKQAEQQKNNKD